MLPITDERMTRFNITLEEGVELVLYALQTHVGRGDLRAEDPELPHPRCGRGDRPGCGTEIVGIRPGEKLHEEMITETDALQQPSNSTTIS